MSLKKEVRGDVDFETHRKFTAIGHAYDRTVADMLQEALDQFIESEVRKAHAGKVLLRIISDNGNEPESSRKAIP